jgi:uncharacterized membrane protein
MYIDSNKEHDMNEASWDRITRVIGGGALLALGAFTFSGAGAVISIVLGLVFLVTGAVGWCPIYAALRIRTRQTESIV